MNVCNAQLLPSNTVSFTCKLVQVDAAEEDVLVSAVPDAGYKISEEGFGGFHGLGTSDEVTEDWKVPILLCASAVGLVVSLIFVVVRKGHREQENNLSLNNDEELFVGELMETDANSLKIIPTSDNETGDIEQGASSSTCSSSGGQSNTFSDVVSKASSNSSNTPSSPRSIDSNDRDFSSMVEGANTNPFSLQSVATSSMEGTLSPSLTITPGKSSPDVMVYEQSCSSSDSLDNIAKSKLTLDTYDWLSVVDESSEEELSKSDLSSFGEGQNGENVWSWSPCNPV